MFPLLEKKWFVYTAGLAFFFVLFRYYGYYEDAGRYLLQAIHFLYPERFINDVSFMFGNQDNFTIFSPFLAFFFKIFGVNHGGIAAYLLIEILWGLSAITLFIRWTRQWGYPAWALPAFIACLVTLTNRGYGSGDYFGIFDLLLVARFAAQALVLCGLAFLWSKNRYISLVIFIGALAIHPLIGGWGLPLWLLYHYPKLRIPLTVAVLIAPLTGFLHVGRFDFFPSDWYSTTLPFTPTGKDALVYAEILVFWWVAWKFCRNLAVSRLASVFFWLTLAGVFWQYAGIISRHELLVQAQPYRVLWIGFIPMFPIAALCLRDFFHKPTPLSLWFESKPRFVRGVFVFALIFLVLSGVLDNFIKLSLEQGIGSMKSFFFFANLPLDLHSLRKIILGALVLICLAEHRHWPAIAFGFSMLNGFFTILPIVTCFFLLFPSVKGVLRKTLLAFTLVFTFAEYLSILPVSPFLESGIQSSIFLVVIFILVLWVIFVSKTTRQEHLKTPLLIMVASLFIWNAFNWDARSDVCILDERQMDTFFESPIFPQIKDRGRILFVEDNESPLQSRFKFLTGTYADATIHIGSLFYKEHHSEAIHRQNALLWGDTTTSNLSGLSYRIANVYDNPDTLLARVQFLCRLGEITHFATDYRNMPLPLQDSLFLNVKQKYMWLYKCEK